MISQAGSPISRGVLSNSSLPAESEWMKTGEVSLVSISRQMGKSCRSLQREIQSYGLSFREMLDRVRQERAFFLLCKKVLSIHEVAWATGRTTR